MEASSSSSSAERKQNRKASIKKRLFGKFRLFGYFRSARVHPKDKSSGNNVNSKAAAIAWVNRLDGIDVLSQSTKEDNGDVRLKIVVKKEDLKQVLELMANNNDKNDRDNNDTNHNNNDYSDDEEDEEIISSVEERLNELRKQHERFNSWIPSLQTIPEEILF